MKIPTDTKSMTEKYKINKGGICGQSCLAIIEESSIHEVMYDWTALGLEFRGWSGWKQLREYLEKKGFDVKQKRWNKLEILHEDYFYILRVQWLGSNPDKLNKPFYGYNHWSEASAHTHFIVVHGGKVFCNEDGLFEFDGLSKYLNGEGYFQSGVITSAMRIKSS